MKSIVLIDVRDGAPDGHLRQRESEALAVRDACLGWLPLGGLLARIADPIVRGWMNRAGTVYAAEIDSVARTLNKPGIWLLHGAYLFGCTALGDESEELLLKVATGPKTTIQPVMPGANRGPITATAVPAGPGAAPAAAGATAPRDVSEVLAERRRLARAQELAAQGTPPGAPVPPPAPSAGIEAPTMPPVPRGDFGSNDPRWQQLYQRYQQPRR